VEGVQVGLVGELHPQVARNFDLARPTSLFEIDLPAILPYVKEVRQYHPIPRVPGVRQDLAVLVDRSVDAARVQAIIQSHPLVAQVTLFDVYVGERIPPDKKSLAYSILYQSPERTLTDEEVREAQDRIVRRLASELGAQLRGQG